MISAITEGIKIVVKTEYQPSYSSPSQSHYVFSYHIRIENNSPYTIQLMRRNWLVFDSNNTFREVEGEGVLGVQPVLEPNEAHEYVSGCNFKTTIGKMSGTYLMQRIKDGRMFTVEIPDFLMIVPYLLN